MKPPIYHRMFNYDVGRLPNAHLADLERGVTSIDEAVKRTGATIGYPGWGLIYHLLLSHLDRSRHEVIIETGTNFGCTTIILAQALIDAGCQGEVITIELDASNVARARENVTRGGVSDRVRLIEGSTRVELPKVVSGLKDVRVAFLDASHAFDDVMTEFETLRPVLADEALVLFDNTYCIAERGEDQRVNGALFEILKAHGGNLINLEYVSWFTPGLAIWQRKPRL